MTVDTETGVCLPGSFLDAATDQVVYLRNCVQCAIIRVEEMARTGDTIETSAAEFRKLLKELREIAGIALKEESRLAEQLSKENGGLHPGAFDLTAAQAEIGRRLAELRAARGDTGVSGQPE
jgi:hypothetical protein